MCFYFVWRTKMLKPSEGLKLSRRRMKSNLQSQTIGGNALVLYVEIARTFKCKKIWWLNYCLCLLHWQKWKRSSPCLILTQNVWLVYKEVCNLAIICWYAREIHEYNMHAKYSLHVVYHYKTNSYQHSIPSIYLIADYYYYNNFEMNFMVKYDTE